MEVIQIAIVVFFFVVIINELASFSSYGPITKKTVSLGKSRLNKLDSGIIVLPNTYISKNCSSFLAKYYINGIGMIPYWSKFHKKVEARHKQLLKEQQCQNDQ